MQASLRNTLIVLTSLVAVLPAYAEQVPIKDLQIYKRADFDRTETECDLIGGHPSDPERIGKGVERADMDLDVVIKVCTKAVKADPANPRLNYQLARAYGYSGRHKEGDSYREAALKAGYPQSLFVVGYIRISGWDGRPADACYGGELVKRSAQAGRLAGLIGFPHYALTGKFSDCKDGPSYSNNELIDFLEKAKLAKPDFYQRLVIEHLEADLADR